MNGFSGEPSPGHPSSRAVSEKLASPSIAMEPCGVPARSIRWFSGSKTTGATIPSRPVTGGTFVPKASKNRNNVSGKKHLLTLSCICFLSFPTCVKMQEAVAFLEGSLRNH